MLRLLRILRDRQRKKQVLVNYFMKYFAELPVMKSGKDVSILKKMYDQMKKLKSGLNAEKNNGLLLVHLFLEKLPAEIFCELSNHSSASCRKVFQNKRRQVLQNKKLYFICFQRQHLPKTSNANYDYEKCKPGKQPYSFCFKYLQIRSNCQCEQTNTNIVNDCYEITLEKVFLIFMKLSFLL